MSKRSRHKLIVDFSRGTVKVAEVEYARDRVIFHDAALIPMPAGPAGEEALRVDQMVERIGAAVQEHDWQGMETACILSRSATSTQSFAFPPMSNTELKQAVRLKLRETLHFDLADAVFDFHKVTEAESVGGRSELLTTVVAARTEPVRKALTVLTEAGLRPTAVRASAEALANLVYQVRLCEEGEAAIHVDIGSTSTILNLLEGRMLRFSREFDVAGESFTRALMRPVITVNGPVMLTHEEAEKVKLLAGYPLEDEFIGLPHSIEASDILPLLEQVAQKMFAEIHRSVEYLRGILHRDRIDRIVLTGPASHMRNLNLVMEENLGIPVTQVDPVDKAISEGQLIVHGAADTPMIGFAAILGCTLGRHRPINLLPPEEKAALWLHKTGRIRKMLTLPLIGAAAAIAVIAVPVADMYDSALRQLETESEQLDKSLWVHGAVARGNASAAETLQDLAKARGRMPNWIGVMKELSNTLPQEVKITSLTARSAQGGVTLRFAAQVNPGPGGFDRAISSLTGALEASPFFANLHVRDARAGTRGSPGRFEADLQIVGGWGTKDVALRQGA